MRESGEGGINTMGCLVAILCAAFTVWGLIYAVQYEQKHCRNLLQTAQTNTDTLIVISSGRCSFIRYTFTVPNAR